MKKFLHIIFFLMLWPAGISAQSPDSLFVQANRLYDQNKYAEALDTYNRILQSGYEAPELYLNMGNAAYRINRKGQAVYYFEKALRLDPHLKAAYNNLTLARRGLPDRFTPLPQGFFQRVLNWYAGLFDLNTWSWLALITAWLTLLFGAVYIWSATPKWKRLFFSLATVLLIVWFMVMAGFHAARRQASVTYGIVQTAETGRHVSPSMASETADKIHEGAKVRILEHQNDWIKVQTPDGNIFWIPANDVWILK